MLSGKATGTNFIVFGLTRTELKPTVYLIRNEHANHYTTDAVRCRKEIVYVETIYQVNLRCNLMLSKL